MPRSRSRTSPALRGSSEPGSVNNPLQRPDVLTSVTVHQLSLALERHRSGIRQCTLFGTGSFCCGQATPIQDGPCSQVVRLVKNPLANARDVRDPWVRKIPGRRAWQPTPVFLPGKSHGQRSLVGHSPCGHEEWDMTEVTQHAYALPGL